jgi:transcriptional regulator with XRE-family HTH domain
MRRFGRAWRAKPGRSGRHYFAVLFDVLQNPRAKVCPVSVLHREQDRLKRYEGHRRLWAVPAGHRTGVRYTGTATPGDPRSQPPRVTHGRPGAIRLSTRGSPTPKYAASMRLVMPTVKLLRYPHQEEARPMTFPFGRRSAEARIALGLTQGTVAKLARLNQPRLSKIERGKEDASVDVIERLAQVFDRDPLEFVKGTDREGHYIAERLKPDQRVRLATEERIRNAVAVMRVDVLYARVVAMFESVYGGSYIVPNFRGEVAYIALRKACRDALHEAEHGSEGLSHLVFFPQHFELEGEEDDRLMGGWEFEASEMRKSEWAIKEALHDFSDVDLSGARKLLEDKMGMTEFDKMIDQVRLAREHEEREWVRRINVAGKNYRDTLGQHFQGQLTDASKAKDGHSGE